VQSWELCHESSQLWPPRRSYSADQLTQSHSVEARTSFHNSAVQPQFALRSHPP